MKFTRRRVLLAMTGAGGAGALTGSGTMAAFIDSESFDASITTGIVDLVVEYELLTGPGSADPEERTGTVDGSVISVPIDSLGSSDNAGSMLLRFILPEGAGTTNNPAALWLATECPVPASTALGESIQLTLSYADCETGEPLDSIARGSVREVADQLRNGIQVDGDLDTDEVACLTDQVCLLIEYELQGYVGTTSIDVPIWFVAVQCRNTTPENPFAGRNPQPCPPGEICPCCRTLGKLELSEGDQPGIGDSYIEAGRYDFTEGDFTYGVEVYDTVEKDDAETTGVAFRLVNRSDPDAVVPSLCTVAIKGGQGEELYDRDDDTLSDTAGLSGADADGLVYAPDGKGISHITVCICTTESEDECPGCTDPSLSDGSPGRPSTPPAGEDR